MLNRVSLRRAVSAAYYALFHLLIPEAILNWKHATHRPAIARHFQHAQMRIASDTTAKRLKSGMAKLNPASREFAVAQGLVSVAESFVVLYQSRQNADYDLTNNYQETNA